MSDNLFLGEDSLHAIRDFVNNVAETKQDVLTFDNTPTGNSNNPVTSHGIKITLNKKTQAVVIVLEEDEHIPETPSDTLRITLDTDTFDLIADNRSSQLILGDDGSGTQYFFNEIYRNVDENDYTYYCHLHLSSYTDKHYVASIEGNSLTVKMLPSTSPADVGTKFYRHAISGEDFENNSVLYIICTKPTAFTLSDLGAPTGGSSSYELANMYFMYGNDFYEPAYFSVDLDAEYMHIIWDEAQVSGNSVSIIHHVIDFLDFSHPITDTVTAL